MSYDFRDDKDVEDLYMEYRNIERQQEALNREIKDLEIRKQKIKERLRVEESDAVLAEKLELLYYQKHENDNKRK